MSLSLSFYTNEKNVLQREIKDWAFEFYLLTGEPRQFMISADWIIEHVLCQILCVVLEFLNLFPNREGWDCFWQAKVLSRLSKTTYLPKVSKNKQLSSILIRSKSVKWAIWESIKSLVIEKLEALNLNSRVSVIQRVLMSTPSQKDWHHYSIFTWLWKISLYLVLGATVIKFGQ